MHIIETGNLAAMPTLSTSESGTTYARARVITNHGEMSKAGKFEATGTMQFNLTVFGKQAEHLVKTAEAASAPGKVRVLFSGRLQAKEYEGKDGTATSLDVLVDEIGVSLQFGAVSPSA